MANFIPAARPAFLILFIRFTPILLRSLSLCEGGARKAPSPAMRRPVSTRRRKPARRYSPGEPGRRKRPDCRSFPGRPPDTHRCIRRSIPPGSRHYIRHNIPPDNPRCSRRYTPPDNRHNNRLHSRSDNLRQSSGRSRSHTGRSCWSSDSSLYYSSSNSRFRRGTNSGNSTVRSYF